MSDPNYEWLAALYAAQGSPNHPSELHGLLVGQVAGGARFTSDQWQTLTAEHLMPAAVLETSADTDDQLTTFYSGTLKSLESSSLDFALIIPDDDNALSERVVALSWWIRGFLEGLALSATDELQKASGDVRELIQDLVAISQIEQDVEDSEDGEQEFFEVAEYVRMAAMNLFAEFNMPDTPVAENGNTLH